MKLEKLKDLIRFNFASDAFALGYHWTYDSALNYQTIVKEKFNYIEPLAKQFHVRGKGEFGSYGDQNLILLESIAVNKKYSSEEFYKLWLNIWKPDYDEWIDQATQITLKTGKASTSNDLSPVSRISPLLLVKDMNNDNFYKNIESYIKMTHNNIEVIEFGKFIGKLIIKLDEKKLTNKELLDLLDILKKEYSMIEKYIDIGIELQDKTPEDIIKLSFPTVCEIDASGPLTIYLFLKFRDNPENMFKWNAILDGDTCSRAGILSTLISADGNFPDFTKKWYKLLKRKDEIEKYLSNF